MVSECGLVMGLMLMVTVIGFLSDGGSRGADGAST